MMGQALYVTGVAQGACGHECAKYLRSSESTRLILTSTWLINYDSWYCTRKQGKLFHPSPDVMPLSPKATRHVALQAINISCIDLLKPGKFARRMEMLKGYTTESMHWTTIDAHSVLPHTRPLIMTGISDASECASTTSSTNQLPLCHK
jgi:hypothetical protein